MPRDLREIIKATYKDRQKAYVSAMGLGEGDRVYVSHKVSSEAAGWQSRWDEAASSMVGKTVTYREFGNSLGLLCKEESSGYEAYLPYMCVVPITDSKPKPNIYLVMGGEDIELSPLQIERIQSMGLWRG